MLNKGGFAKVLTNIECKLKIAFLIKYINYRVNALNFGSVLNIGNGPQSGPSLRSEVKGHKAGYQNVMGPIAAKRPISV